MTRVISFLSNMLLYLAAAALVLMMLHVSLDVAGKYIFLSPIRGTAEIVADYYMIAAVFLPLAYMELTDQPIVAELFYKMAPDRFKFVLLIIAHIFSLIFYALLAWYSLGVAINAYEIGQYAVTFGKVIVWPSKFFLPLGLSVACIALCLKIHELLQAGPDRVKASPESEAEGDEWII
jgi:TRAP-type C4-dicarboxylate transport system permease small subunit